MIIGEKGGASGGSTWCKQKYKISYVFELQWVVDSKSIKETRKRLCQKRVKTIFMQDPEEHEEGKRDELDEGIFKWWQLILLALADVAVVVLHSEDEDGQGSFLVEGLLGGGHGQDSVQTVKERKYRAGDSALLFVQLDFWKERACLKLSLTRQGHWPIR